MEKVLTNNEPSKEALKNFIKQVKKSYEKLYCSNTNPLNFKDKVS